MIFFLRYKATCYNSILIAVAILGFFSCTHKKSPNDDMIAMLRAQAQFENDPKNPYAAQAIINHSDSVIEVSAGNADGVEALFLKANALLELGKEQKAIDIYKQLLGNGAKNDYLQSQFITKKLALAYLRLGERTNCIHNHTAESCIYPISPGGVHADKTGSEEAIKLYKKLLEQDSHDYESRWLINIAYMTTGEYPAQVPPDLLIKQENKDALDRIKPFKDVAGSLGLNTRDMAGGVIIDDFNNDGYPDIITSSWGLDETMHYFQNNRNGTFTDMSQHSGLGYLTGGLQIIQTDYNNDGLKDIFVLRGAWQGKFGKEPNSLLRNNGDGTFTDVTRQSGLLSFHPTQTATWADFNNDGWLDLFIGNESKPGDDNPCELYINNKNGTFTNVAVQANCAISAFVKGVTSGDFDNDGLPDIFISTMTGEEILLKNETVKNGPVKFKNVTQVAGIKKNPGTFATWFWDYDNDGWPDILICGYGYTESLAKYAAQAALHIPNGDVGKVYLYRNKHDGTFEDVSDKMGLNKLTYAMGGNFGDIDNDGYLDFYLGTGNRLFESLIPNKLFKNVDGKRFIDVTSSARVGSLQKGHGVSFADMNNDGNEDIFIHLGGAYAGDAYENALYINPGQGGNHWINIALEGAKSNRAAIGAHIKVTFKSNGIERSVYRDVNSGGSFGSNPLQQHIGIAQATLIENIEIKWPTSGLTQQFNDVAVDQNIKIKEGSKSFSTFKPVKFNFPTGMAGMKM